MKVSVIIPVYNDPDGIETTLDSLTSQTTTDLEYEIIVVDNDSSDRTPEIIKKYTEKYPDLITDLVENKIQSSYAARNTGLEHSSGDIITFIDADMWVNQDWIHNILEHMSNTNADYVGFDITLRTDNPSSQIASNYNELTGFPIEEYVQEFNYAPTACLIVRSKVIEEIGGFDPRLVSGGDKVFGNRVKDAGFELEYCGYIKSYHPTRTSSRDLLMKAVRIGRGKVQLEQYYPKYSDQGGMFSYRNYLPPSPSNMKRRIDKRENIPLSRFALLFLFGTVYKYVRLYGMWLEFINQYTKSNLKNNRSIEKNHE